MIIEISLALAVLIFAVLAVYIIQTLIALQATLRRIDAASIELALKLRNLDSTLRTISNLGEITEHETEKLKLNFMQQDQLPKSSNFKTDLAEWLLASVKLGSKLYSRRKSYETD